MKVFLRKNGLPCFVTIVLAVILFKLLFLAPNVGYADNGDFGRVTVPFGIDFHTDRWDEKFFNFARLRYVIDDPSAYFSPVILHTSHLTAIALAKLINITFFSAEIFDIRSLSGIYYVIFLVSVFFIVKGLQIYTKPHNRIINVIVVLFLIFAAGDARNIAYFNSFYSEAFAYVSFFAALAFAIWSGNKPKNPFIFAGLMLCAALFFTSKPQYTVLSVPFVFSLILHSIIKHRRIRIGALSACLIVLGVSVSAYCIVPEKISNDTLFNSVFNGILKDTDDAEGRLRELGLDESFAQYANRQIYVVTPSKEMLDDFNSRMTKGRVLKYYLKHPVELLMRMEHTAAAFDNIGSDDLGNFDISQNPKPKAKNNFFILHSKVKRFIPHTLWFIATFYLAYAAALVFAYKSLPKNRRFIIEILAVLAVMGIIQFPMPVLANGETDIGKQLFFFNLTFDISFAGFLCIAGPYVHNKFFCKAHMYPPKHTASVKDRKSDCKPR